MVQNCAAEKYGYALKNMAEYRARVLEQTKEGMQLELDKHTVYLPFVGLFNAYNLLAVYATADLLGQDADEVALAMSQLAPPAGRLQQFMAPNGILGVVDYAHTPDALQNVLVTLSAMKEGGRIITVFGAGGDRDRDKRPEMGTIAGELSDQVILTSDNPRSESPEAIIEYIYAGVRPQHQRRVLRITDRREAIRTAVQLAQAGDIVLVAGKGHESYQEVAGQRHHFDDREVLLAAFNELTTA
ncbi:MAG: Mur ligase family protein, partial [Bacteroidota bacterium]